MAEDSQRERRRERQRLVRRRRRIALLVAAFVLAILVGALQGFSGGGGAKPAAHAAHAARKAAARPLSPPGPIPGYLLIADRGNNQMLLMDGAKRIYWRYPRPGVTPAMPFHFDDDTFFGPTPDRIISNQEEQHTIQVISIPGGRVLWRYGHVDLKGASPGYLNTPDDAYLLKNGLVSVADAYNCRVVFISSGHGIVRQYGTGPGSCRHNPPHMTRTGRVLWRYGPSSGPGELNHPSLALQIAPDLIAVNDDYRHRVVLISIRRGRIVWQYGHTDVPGSGPGYLNTPDGLDLLSTARAQASPSLRRLLSAQPPVSAVAVAGFRLPAPVQREVGVADGGQVLLAGGLDPAGRSTNAVFRVDPATGAFTRLGTVPQAFHDAAGALLGGRLYVFGGGTGQSSSAVQAFDVAGRRGSLVAHLPRAVSDLASAQSGSTVYLVGGYDGSRPRPEIYRTTDGTHFRLAGRLPVGLRYPAVALAGSTLLVAGGIGPGGASSAVYAFDPSSGRSTLLGRLSTAAGHAAAVAFGDTVYVVGGTPAVAARIDVARRFVTAVDAPVPLSDTAAVALGDRALLFGGTVGGTATAAVYELRPASARR